MIIKETDVIQVIIAGAGGLGALMTNLDLALKILIGVASLGFIIYKWRCAYVDRKKRNG